MQEQRQLSREELLATTLRYVVQTVPYYRGLPGLAERGDALALADFPLLEKEVIAARLHEFLVLDRFPDYIVTSGGTSGGPPNVTFRNAEEYEAAHSYFSGLLPGELPDPETLAEFTIDVFFNTNGYVWRKPQGWPMLSMTLEQPAHAETIRRLIEEGLVVAGRRLVARHLQSQNGTLRTLTGYFWATGFRPAEHGVATVLPYGGHVSRAWETRLAEFWGAEIRTLYGLSEFAVGNAMPCRHCGGYHYWTAWAEFLALDGDEPVQEGDARLVLTTLLPFTYVQPRVRYLTGDIVTLTGRCSGTGEPGFRFRGRSHSTVVAGEGPARQVLLSEVEATEVLEQLADVNCRPHASEAPLWADPSLPRPPFVMGFPRFEVGAAPALDASRSVEIRFETVFDPGHEPARAAALRERFLEVLNADFPGVAERAAAHGVGLDVRLLPPGALKVRIKAAL